MAAERKRPLVARPRAIGVVTSLDAAALHDVMTALRRRLPHIPVLIVPAPVQGAQAAAALAGALRQLYGFAESARERHPAAGAWAVDVVLLVRGGGSVEDLWSFNDEGLARTLIESPVPVVSGVGHETDFSIADFVADLRAPTPTAAAELIAAPRDTWLQVLDNLQERLGDAVLDALDLRRQRLDRAAQRLGRPSGLVAQHRLRLSALEQRLRHAMALRLHSERNRLRQTWQSFPACVGRSRDTAVERLGRAQLRLRLLDPRLVLERGYAWISDEQGHAITSVRKLEPGQQVLATLADGQAALSVLPRDRA